MDRPFALRLHYFAYLRQDCSVALVLTHLYKLAAVGVGSYIGVYLLSHLRLYV